MKKNKEHKKGESTIGKIIYGFLLFMPLFAIGVTCGYAMFNKNAYQSYENRFIESATTITATNQLVVNNEYNLNIDFTTDGTNIGAYRYYYSNINVNWVDYGAQNRPYYSFKVFRLGNNNNYYFWLYYNDNNFEQISISNANVPYLTFTYTNIDVNNSYAGFGGTLSTYTYKPETLSNVFYYAVDKVTESPLFSWTQNSIIYTTLNNTCNTLSITTPFIPLLLAYWLIISVIYFLYDIALMLIWLLHDKIHEMRDSLA